MSRYQRIWLCAPPAALALLDGTLTLLGQSEGYWSGDYGLVREYNPIGWVFLCWHPLAFALALIVWTVLILGGIAVLPRRLAVPLMFLVCFCHSIGAASWLTRYGWCGWVLAVALLVLAERMLSLAWRKAKVREPNVAFVQPKE